MCNIICMYRGKGDYHRLGHGTDDHVRRPRRVTALQGKKVISIACGSLHCVACTDSGKCSFYQMKISEYLFLTLSYVYSFIAINVTLKLIKYLVVDAHSIK